MTKPDYRRIHRESYLFDSHADTAARVFQAGRGKRMRKDWPMQIDPSKLAQGEFGGLFFAAFVPPGDPRPTWRAFSIIETTRKLAASHPRLLAVACNSRELAAARSSGRIAVMHSLENGGEALGGNLDLIEAFYRCGVRCFGLVWNRPNCLAVGVSRPRGRSGLTEKGREAIRILNGLGVIIDVSHLNEAGFRDAVRLTRSPIIASHSNVHALHPVRRNLKDYQIRAIARTGGVIGVNVCPKFLTRHRVSTISNVVDHVEYVATLVGVDHVGIGTDFDGTLTLPRDLPHAGKMPLITRELLRRGFKVGEIKKILGTNHLRVIRQVIG